MSEQYTVNQVHNQNQAGVWVSLTFICLIVVGFIFLLATVRLDTRPTLSQAQATFTAAAAAKAAQPTEPPAAGSEDVQVVAKEEPRTLVYTLRTNLGGNPPMAFIGVGGAIEGQANPTLTARVGDRVKLTVVNGDGSLHDLVINEFGVNTGQFSGRGKSVTVEFVAGQPGEFEYFCGIPGHKESGMIGKLRVTGEAKAGTQAAAKAAEPPAAETPPPAQPAAVNAVSVVRNPADLPPPVGNREPTTLRIDLTTTEVTGVLADGTTYNYFTFDGKIPGPMLRVRVGDTVELHLKNAENSLFSHSIDLHAVTGPGGGAVYTQTTPGGETFFTFKAINPGLYVYHCATASIPHHISNGMYGLILVEPEGGLPPVDREFYVMQGELYTDHAFGTKGHLNFDPAKMSQEDAEYVTFNGAAAALTSDENVLRARVGDTVRIFFGVGGPNYTSSFHVIGEIFDRVYEQASLTASPLTDVQTTMVPPGGATMVEFKLDVPGRYILVDHALSRLERGLAGYLIVEGDDHPEVFHGENASASAGH